MFCGIIEGMGTIKATKGSSNGRVIDIAADFSLNGTKTGDSIAVNGACLTVTRISGNIFSADVSAETLSKTNLASLSLGQKVNLERAMKLTGRIDGHIVSGHVDGTARIIYKKNFGNAIIIGFEAESELTQYMIPKGSVAVDGISLTINKLFDTGFSVAIIPHTAKITTLGQKGPGDIVNIETDMIGKYVYKYMLSLKDIPLGDKKGDGKESDSTLELLKKSGFIE